MAVKKRPAGKAKKGTVEVDFTGVETSVLVPEADYIVEVVKAKKGIAESSGKPKIDWKMKISEGEYAGNPLYYTTSLQKQALFNLKKVLLSLGVSVADGAMKLNLESYPGMKAGVTVAHEVYNKKTKAKIVEWFPMQDFEESDEDLVDEDEEVEEEEVDDDEDVEVDEDEDEDDDL